MRKVPNPQAIQILSRYTQSEGLAEKLKAQPELSALAPESFLSWLLEQQLLSDAVTFFAFALPMREAIWWAICCLDTKKDWNQAEQNAIRAAKSWFNNNDEVTRRYAENCIAQAGLKTGAGWLAQAVFWTGGSISKPGDAAIPPPAHIYAEALAGAINLTALLPEPTEAFPRYEHFFAIGFDIAQGGNGNVPMGKK